MVAVARLAAEVEDDVGVGGVQLHLHTWCSDTRHVTRDTRPAQPHLAVGVLAVAALAGGAAAAVSRPGGAGHKG